MFGVFSELPILQTQSQVRRKKIYFVFHKAILFPLFPPISEDGFSKINTIFSDLSRDVTYQF